MNFTDQEVLELTELCNALADGTLTETQRARLAEWLAASEEARRFYVRFVNLAASLCHYASEMQVEAPDGASIPMRFWRRPAFGWSFGPLAAAAAAVVAIFLAPDFSARKTEGAMVELETQDFVAQVTGMKDCVWADSATDLEPGDQIGRGQRLKLTSGVVEITFDCGAQVTLEGPATLELNSAWDATLSQGTLSAVVPTEAIGFRVSNPDVDVVDLGTEFSMVAQSGSATEVYVHKGKVQTIPRDNDGHEQPAFLLIADQSRQFNHGGSADIRHAKPKFKSLARHARKGHAASQTESLQATPNSGPAPTANRFANALKFDGHFETHLSSHSLMRTAPYTVAFWVRVPAGAALSAAGAMVAWSSEGGKGKSAPVQITWNTDPAAGALGTLRTEYKRAAAVGTTTLRDGQWHHVAVVFVPHGRGHGRLHVKQYVDGHLEDSVAQIIPKHACKKYKIPASDIVWLGRRLGSSEHFHGELDEFSTTGHALAPQQIKTLLAGGRPESLSPSGIKP